MVSLMGRTWWPTRRDAGGVRIPSPFRGLYFGWRRDGHKQVRPAAVPRPTLTCHVAPIRASYAAALAHWRTRSVAAGWGFVRWSDGLGDSWFRRCDRDVAYLVASLYVAHRVAKFKSVRVREQARIQRLVTAGGCARWRLLNCRTAAGVVLAVARPSTQPRRVLGDRVPNRQAQSEDSSKTGYHVDFATLRNPAGPPPRVVGAVGGIGSER